MVRKLAFILFLSLLLSKTCLGQSTILWHEGNPLEWKDFKARPDGGSKFSALTSATFDIKAKPAGQAAVEIRITSKFNPTGSWVKKGKKKDELLRREQLHFDICEMHARELRKKIQSNSWNAKSFSKKFNKLVKKEFKLYKQTQSAYDKETKHSINKSEQASWESDIENRLKALEACKQTLFKLNLD